MSLWCVANNIEELPEDGVDKRRNAEIKKWLAYKNVHRLVSDVIQATYV